MISRKKYLKLREINDLENDLQCMCSESCIKQEEWDDFIRHNEEALAIQKQIHKLYKKLERAK